MLAGTPHDDLASLIVAILLLLAYPADRAGDRDHRVGGNQAKRGRACRVIFHFAYGSNISRAVMRRHAPGAEAVGVATLANYRFLITTHGHASVAPLRAKTVYGGCGG